MKYILILLLSSCTIVEKKSDCVVSCDDCKKVTLSCSDKITKKEVQ